MVKPGACSHAALRYLIKPDEIWKWVRGSISDPELFKLHRTDTRETTVGKFLVGENTDWLTDRLCSMWHLIASVFLPCFLLHLKMLVAWKLKLRMLACRALNLSFVREKEESIDVWEKWIRYTRYTIDLRFILTAACRLHSRGFWFFCSMWRLAPSIICNTWVVWLN